MWTFGRVRALAIMALLLAVAVVTVSMALERDANRASAEGGCPEGFVPVRLTLPAEGEVTLNVYNATNRAGLANRIAENFANRGFQVLERGDYEPEDDEEIEGVAELRFGPQALGAARLVEAYFLNQATTVFDINREDDVVDVILGPEFQQLATPTEVSQSIAASGNPSPPPGTCPVDD